MKRCKEATALIDLGRNGSGSGFLIHRSGLFVTNRHVVASVPPGEPVKLVLHSGEENEKVIEARIAFVAKDDDLVFLKTDAEITAEPLEFADAEKARLVELSKIIVLGYPFGRRLAAEGQDYPSISINTGRISRLEKVDARLSQIQYDAATNPGNSGGPMITADGSVVGVVVSGYRGADINFAIPAERVMKLLERPVVGFYPTVIPFGKRSAEQDFEIELLPNASLPANPEVTLHLGKTGEQRRSFSASLSDGRFRVAAPLLEPSLDASPLRLQIEAKLPDATITANVDDCPVKVGDRQMMLSSILAVGEANGITKTVIGLPGENQRYETLDGVPTGLPVLHSERHDLELSLDSVTELRVRSYGFEFMDTPFEIEVKGSDGVIFNRKGTVRLGDPPPNLAGSTRPKKKDFFSSMFRRNEQGSELDLLSLVDAEKDSREGSWEVVGEAREIVMASDSPSWLELPARPTGDYSLTVEVVPSEDSKGELQIHLPVEDSVVMLRFDGGVPGSATIANDADRDADKALEIPPFNKGVPFRIQATVSDGKLVAVVTVTRKEGNLTSQMTLPERLIWSGDSTGLSPVSACPLPPTLLGLGISGQKMRITAAEIQARPGYLLVSRDLPPTVRHHPSGSAVHWSLDDFEVRNMAIGREQKAQRDGFPNFGSMQDMSYAGPPLGDPEIGAEPYIEGGGAMRLEGDKAGFQLPSHPRLWNSNFTVAFWFMADAIADKTRRHLFDEGGRNIGASLYLLGDTLRAGAWDDSAAQGGEKWQSWLNAPGIKPDEWYHVALALDADADDKDTALRLFLNGALVDEGFGTGLNEKREPGAVGTILGSSRPCPEDPADTRRTQFEGLIDEFSIFGTALNADSVKLLVGGRFAEAGTQFASPPVPDQEKIEIDLNGRWVDMNGGTIEIRHDGGKVEAIALGDSVKRHWTRGQGRLRGTKLKIDHYKNGNLNGRKTGNISEDKNRIVWSPTTHWKRLPDEEAPIVGAVAADFPPEAFARAASSEMPVEGFLKGLGNDTSGNPFDLSQAEQFDDFVDVEYHFNTWAAIRKSGAVLSNDSQLHGLERVAQIALTGPRAYVLHRNGSVSTLPEDPDQPEELPPIRFLSVSFKDVVAVTMDDRVVAWGKSLGTANAETPESLKDVVTVATIWGSPNRPTQAFALTREGTVISWGDTGPKAIKLPDDLPPIRDIEAGWTNLVCLTREGEVICFGPGDENRLPVPDLVTNSKADRVRLRGPMCASRLIDGRWRAWWWNSDRLQVVQEGPVAGELNRIRKAERIAFKLSNAWSGVFWIEPKSPAEAPGTEKGSTDAR